MRLVTYVHLRGEAAPRPGLVQGDRVLDVAALLPGLGPLPDLLALLDLGPTALSALAEAAATFAAAHRDAPEVPAAVAVPAWETRLLAPLPRPRGLRDFMAFEQHVRTTWGARGRPVPPAWYEAPVFAFGNPGSVVSPDAEVPRPATTAELDFELELACVIGTGGRDIPVARAAEHVAGYMVMNDWSARDTQRREMSVGLGPAKAKDFATSLGPALVTPDDLADRLVDGRYRLSMVARMNDEEVCRADAADQHWTFAELIAHASRDADLVPGDVLGSGTVGGGSLLELRLTVGQEDHPWLEPGDEVELEIERIGRLRNTVT